MATKKTIFTKYDSNRKRFKDHKDSLGKEADEEGKSTKPNQALKVKDFIEMHKRGIRPDVLHDALYDEEVFGQDVSELLGTEIHDRFQLVERIKELDETVRKKGQKKKFEEQQKQVYEKANQWLVENGYKDEDGNPIKPLPEGEPPEA